MERFFNILVGLAWILTACNQEPDILPTIEGDQDEIETKLTQTWRYKDVIINNAIFSSTTFNSVMEPDKFTSRNIVNKRKIVYEQSGSYQLQWDNRGEYQLGTEGDPNWQPGFGYWHLEDDMLIHNGGLEFETRYQLEVGQYTMIRTHTRYMSKWGEYVHFVERFTSDDTFKAGGEQDVPQQITITSEEKGTFTITWKRPDISDLNGFDFGIFESGNTSDTLLQTNGRFPARDNAFIYGVNDDSILEIHIWSRFDNGNTSRKEIVSLTTNPLPLPPANLVATPMVNSVLLEWEIPESNVVQGFKLVTDPDAVDTLDLKMATSHTITNLNPATNYTFYLFSYDANGCTSEVTSVSAIPFAPGAGNLPFIEIYGSCSNDWIVASDGNKNWQCTNSNDFPLHGNAFGMADATGTSELWLISPLIDPGTASPVLSFEYLSFLSDNEGYGLKVRVLTDYSGSGIPTNKGVLLEAGINNSLNMPEFELSNFVPMQVNTPFHLAFLSTNSQNMTGVISAVDNIRVEYKQQYGLPFFEDFNKESIVQLPNWTRYSFGNVEDHWRNNGIGASGLSGDVAALMDSYNSDENADTPGDDWLISPEIDLSNSDAVLSFDYATNFTDQDPLGGVRILISEDYEIWTDPTVANWHELDFISAPTNPEPTSTPVYQSKEYALTGYSVPVYIAYHYTSSGSIGGQSIIFRVDNFMIE